MVCCNCKKNISDEDLFCRFCGARQSKVIEKKWTEFRTVKLDLIAFNLVFRYGNNIKELDNH